MLAATAGQAAVVHRIESKGVDDAGARRVASGNVGEASPIGSRLLTLAPDQEPSTDMPWVIEPSATNRPPLAQPDWTMIPSRALTPGRSSTGARAAVMLSARRSDTPEVPGSVFNSAFGAPDAPPIDPEGGTTNFEGRSVIAAPTKYFQDFEDGSVAREWELTGLDDMDKFGRFAGPYRNATQTLYVKCDPDVPYVVTFDLLFIAANLGDPEASDVFKVSADGQTLLEDRFTTLRERNEKFNSDREDFDRDIYKQVSLTFTPKGNGIITIKFKCDAAGLPGGETWGLDNVHIDIAPKQTLGEIGQVEAGPLSVLGGMASGGATGGGYAGDDTKSYFRGDASIRQPGPRGPTSGPTPVPAPTPGAGALLMLGGGMLAARRRR